MAPEWWPDCGQALLRAGAARVSIDELGVSAKL